MTTKLRPSVKQGIDDQAELLSLAEPKKERAQFKKDYIKNSTQINQQLGTLLDRLLKESTPLALAYHYNVPGLAQKSLQNLRAFSVNLTQNIIDSLSKIESTAIRKLAINFIRNTLKVLHESIVNKEVSTNKRKGGKNNEN